MDTSISNQLLKCRTGHFAANRIKSRQNNGFRRIINNEINTSKSFQCTNITAFTADNPAFHLFIRKCYHRYGCFSNMISCTALDSQSNDFAGLLVRFFLGLLFNFFDHLRSLVANFLLYIA
ncbi:hypothetical protein D3C86_1941280 [compost metagenome]